MNHHKSTADVFFKVLVFICGAALVGTSVLVGLEVICRNFLGFSLQGTDEISGYVLAGISAWGFAYAAWTRGHIRIDSLIQIASQPLRAWLDVLAYASLLVVAIMLSYYAWTVLSFSIAKGSVSQTPLMIYLWIPQAVWVSGLIVFAGVCAYLVAQGCYGLARREYSQVTNLLNVDEVDMEISVVEKNDNAPGEAQ